MLSKPPCCRTVWRGRCLQNLKVLILFSKVQQWTAADSGLRKGEATAIPLNPLGTSSPLKASNAQVR